MSTDDQETNRAHWDALAAVHGQDDYYYAEALVGGADSLGDHEAASVREAVGEVGGLVPHRVRLDLAGAPRRARDSGAVEI